MTDVEKYDDESRVPALPDDMKGVGLEDIDESDLTTPRLKILHQEGLFEHPQSNQRWESFDCVLLGMIKQRTLWPPTLGEEGDPPLCRSFDFKTGYSNDEVFPWEESGFDPPADDNKSDPLPCADCNLKQWDTHPLTKNPWCNEQHVYPLLIIDEEDDYIPVILTLSKTGIKPSRAYLNPFFNSGRPLFTVVTNLSLSVDRKGGNKFSVPVFKRVGPTDRVEWDNWAAQYRRIKAFLNTPRAANVEDEESVASPARKEPTKRAATKTSKPKSAAKEVEAKELWDEDSAE